MPAFNNPLHTRQWNNFDGARMPTRPFRHTMNGTNGVAVHSPVSSGWPALLLSLFFCLGDESIFLYARTNVLYTAIHEVPHSVQDFL